MDSTCTRGAFSAVITLCMLGVWGLSAQAQVPVGRGLVFHLDAQRPGAAEEPLRDISGMQNHPAGQGQGPRFEAQLYDKPVYFFDNNGLEVDLSGQTVFVVLAIDADAPRFAAVAGGRNDRANIRRHELGRHWRGGQADGTDGNDFAHGGLSRVDGVDSAFGHNEFEFGQLHVLVQQSAEPANLLSLGVNPALNQRYFKGGIGEILVYDRALTAEQIREIESYLMVKWLDTRPVDGRAVEQIQQTLAQLDAGDAGAYEANIAKLAGYLFADSAVVRRGAENALEQALGRALARELVELMGPGESFELAMQDMIDTFGGQAEGYLEKYQQLRDRLGQSEDMAEKGRLLYRMLRVRREALLSNPLLDFDQLAVLVRRFGPEQARSVIGVAAGHPDNSFATEASMRSHGWDNEIAILSPLNGDGQLTTMFKPETDVIIRNLDLDFDGERLMFSSVDQTGRWALFEVDTDGTNHRQLTPTEFEDVDYFDSCYLPDGRIITASTASYGAIDCVAGAEVLSDLYLFDPENESLRQLTFDQVHPQHPVVRNDGTVMYMRWEYCDLAHYFSRFLFTMNPDGTGQRAIYGSGSMFPTAMRHSRDIPGHAGRVVTIVGGHHGIAESGRMAIIDTGMGRSYPFRYEPSSRQWAQPGSLLDIYPEVLPAEVTGFVQEIPGYGKDVVGNVRDEQVNGVWPHFVYPWPLNEHYFLVSMKYDQQSLWGIYLVDVFDNMTLIKELDGAALFEPIPLRARKRPPVIPDRIDPDQNKAWMLIQDIYAGPGLEGVPRGTVKELRVFAYHYSYNHTGNHHALSRGTQGPWDVRRILGTVEIESDGSAYFEVPADTPISIQPIDEKGRAVQLMRSWTLGMPGEIVSCVGCHESMDQSASPAMVEALRGRPKELEPWFGPPRPFSYEFEVQPVLDKYCVGCHDDQTSSGGISFARTPDDFVYNSNIPDSRQVPDTSRNVERSFDNLHPYARRPGPESQLMMLVPMEFHASTSPLMQMLEKGHHGVELDDKARRRLYTWIDLNTPFYGRWNPPKWRGHDQAARRAELAGLFSSQSVDPEAEYEQLMQLHSQAEPAAWVEPAPWTGIAEDDLSAQDYALTPQQARQLQRQDVDDVRFTIEPAEGVSIEFVWVPGGSFVMGSLDGYADEQPRSVIEIEEGFWMAVTEISNAQYALFDAEHDTGYHVCKGKDKAVPGHIANHRDQPVSRVSWQEAMAFCDWLSEKTGLTVTLPTEAQWEWAARAGTTERFYWGTLDDDFSDFANLADRQRLYTRTTWEGPSLLQNMYAWDPDHHYPLRDDRFDDGALVTNYVGQYQPNAWGLHDMIGNVWQWTRSSYLPYPYNESDGRNDGDITQRKVARGGSWYDRGIDAGAAVRLGYQSWQKVFNVGFRIIVEP